MLSSQRLWLLWKTSRFCPVEASYAAFCAPRVDGLRVDPAPPLPSSSLQDHNVRKKIADTTGEIASMILESETGAWPEILPFLFQSARSQNGPLRESSMLIIARLTYIPSLSTPPHHCCCLNPDFDLKLVLTLSPLQ
jgi:hypothetical protein